MKNNLARFDAKDTLFLCVISIIAVALRFLYFRDYCGTDIYPVLPFSDAYFYDAWARDIVAGDFLGSRVFMKWPLYAYLVASLYSVSGQSTLFVFLLQNMFGVLHCILIYVLAKYFFNRQIACISSLLCVFYSFFVFYDSLLIYTSFSLFLNSVFFLALLYVRQQPKPLPLLGAGLLLGAATLVQPNILLFGIAAAVLMLWQHAFTVRQRTIRFCIFCAPVFLLFVSTAVRNYAVEKDTVMLTAHAGVNFFLGNNPEANGIFHCPEYLSANQEGMFRDAQVLARAVSKRPLKPSEVNRFWFNRSFEFIRNNPGGFLGLLKRKIIYLFSGEEFVHDAEYPMVKEKVRSITYMLNDLRFVLPFALLGMFLGFARLRQLGLLYCFIVTVTASILPFFVTTRYRVMQVPVLFMFAAFGLWSIIESIRAQRYVRLGVLYLGVIAFFLFCNYNGLLVSRNAYRGSDSEQFDHALRRAVQLTHSGNFPDALKDAAKATSLKPQSPRSLFALAVAQFHAGNLREAEDNFKLVAEKLPFSVDALYNLGVLYSRQHRFEQAKEFLSRAVRLDPDDVSAHFELARAYAQTGQGRHARQHYSLALQKINRWRTKDRALITQELSAVEK